MYTSRDIINFFADNEEISRSAAIGWIDLVMRSYKNIALYPKQSVPLQIRHAIINLET
jgi:hypothetical protein